MSETPSEGHLFRYEPINIDQHFVAGSGTEYRRQLRLCDKAFERFEKNRGRILSDAIAVEKELDRAIAGYFTPRGAADDTERRIRHNAFVDLVLGLKSFSFNAKVETVATLLDVVEIREPSKKRFQNTLKPVMRTRNKVAHRRVGVDWKTGKVGLWDATKRQWEVLEQGFEELYTKSCREASAMTFAVVKEIWRLQANDA